MAHLHITCINKHPTHKDRHHHIQAVGGTWGKHTAAQAIAFIEAGVNSYYTTGGGKTANVKVDIHRPSGTKFLITDADSTTKDNLLSLDECR